MRTIGNPILLKPKTMQLYVPMIDEITNDFLKL
jgi:hypothetical protein